MRTHDKNMQLLVDTTLAWGTRVAGAGQVPRLGPGGCFGVGLCACVFVCLCLCVCVLSVSFVCGLCVVCVCLRLLCVLRVLPVFSGTSPKSLKSQQISAKSAASRVFTPSRTKKQQNSFPARECAISSISGHLCVVLYFVHPLCCAFWAFLG